MYCAISCSRRAPELGAAGRPYRTNRRSRSVPGTWWAFRDLNPGPIGYEPTALTTELKALDPCRGLFPRQTGFLRFTPETRILWRLALSDAAATTQHGRITSTIEEKECVPPRYKEHTGGKRGIRTLGTFPFAGLANLCNRPLCQLPMIAAAGEERKKTCSGAIFEFVYLRDINWHHHLLFGVC